MARDWRRPARHLVTVFVLLALVPSVLLVAFGWRLLQQDRALEAQQARLAREQAADVIVAALEQQVGAMEAALRAGTAVETVRAHRDSAAVSFSGGPGPAVAGADHIFEDAERLEFIQRDLAAAAAAYRRAAGSPDRAIRAGALIRLARVLRKTQSNDAALATYDQAASLRGSTVGGVPADLLARWAKCDLFEKLERAGDLRSEGGRLLDDLLAGRWQLTRAQLETHVTDASRWSARPDALSQAREPLALASAIDSLRERWQQRSTSVRFAGRAQVHREGIRHTLLWQEQADGASAVAIGDGYIREQWLSKVSSLAERHGVRVAAQSGSGAGAVTRTAAETGLPWALTIEAVDPRVPGLFAGRRAIWLAGLMCLLLVMGSGTYVVGRAVSRELAVARVQSDFVAAVSHEFRTPLTSLRQLTEMLIDRPPDQTRARQYYDTLARQTDRLHRLVENLLDFGRMEAGTSPYRLEPVDACAFAGDVARQFEADPAARGHRVHVAGDAEAGCVLADRDALARALWNLFDNAAKYSPGAEAIWVDLMREPASILIRVRDAGLGIPAAEQREIFAKFVRGSTAKAENIGGTGIGLAMVRHIALAHGGSVDVESQPGAGSTFTLRLPIASGARESATEAACLGS